MPAHLLHLQAAEVKVSSYISALVTRTKDTVQDVLNCKASTHILVHLTAQATGMQPNETSGFCFSTKQHRTMAECRDANALLKESHLLTLAQGTWACWRQLAWKQQHLVTRVASDRCLEDQFVVTEAGRGWGGSRHVPQHPRLPAAHYAHLAHRRSHD